MKVAVYCRVSTEDQADAKTIENQVDFAQRYCGLHGLEISGFYLDDGVSGALPVESRPEGARLLSDAMEGCFAVVCVYRLDRLARTALEILKTHQRLTNAGVVLKSMTENFDTSTPSGKFFMTTLGGIAEIERETIAERMRLGKERALREGRWPGGPPPYGYKLANHRLAVDLAEAKVVRQIFRLYAGGGMSAGSIADYLNATGVPAPGSAPGKGGALKNRWYGSRIWSILTNQAYRGVFLFRRAGPREAAELSCPPLVSPLEWESAREALRVNSLDSRRSAKREYLLKGLIKCGRCGRTYCGDGSGGKGGRFYYRCAGSSSGRAGGIPCRSRSLRADLLEELVWEDICRYLLGTPGLLVRVGLRAGPDQEPAHGGRQELEAINGAFRDKEKERRRVIGLFRRKLISGEEAGAELESLSRELAALEKRRQIIETSRPGESSRLQLAERLRQRLDGAGPREKRDLVRGLVAGITVVTVEEEGKSLPRATISYVFDNPAGCLPGVETRGKYRLGVPKSPY